MQLHFKYMKYFLPYNKKNNQIKAHFSHMRYQRSNDLIINSIRLDERQLAITRIFGGSVKWYILFEAMLWQHPSKSKMYIIFDTTISSQATYQIDTHLLV